MVAIVLRLALISLLPKALGLDCWGCHSTESWADCESKLQSAFCGNDSTHACMTREVTETKPEKTTIHYFKECGKRKNCDEASCSMMVQDTKYSCQISCCCHDNCNTGVIVKDEVQSRAGVPSLHVVCAIVSLVMVFTQL